MEVFVHSPRLITTSIWQGNPKTYKQSNFYIFKLETDASECTYYHICLYTCIYRDTQTRPLPSIQNAGLFCSSVSINIKPCSNVHQHLISKDFWGRSIHVHWLHPHMLSVLRQQTPSKFNRLIQSGPACPFICKTV